VLGDPVNFIDPDGKIPVHIIIGAGIGAASGAIGVMRNPNATIGSIIRGALVGGAIGGISALVPITGPIMGAIKNGAKAGFFGNTAGQLSDPCVRENFSLRAALTQGLIGGASGGAGHMAGFASSLASVKSGLSAAQAIPRGAGVGTTVSMGTSTVINSFVSGSGGGMAP